MVWVCSLSREMAKPWQLGYPLDRLVALEARFASWNAHAQHDLGRFKKNDIAPALAKGELRELEDGAVLHVSATSKRTAVTSLPGVVLGYKEAGDLHVKHWGYGSPAARARIVDALAEHEGRVVWLYVHAECAEDVLLATECGFRRVGTKYTSPGDVLGVFLRGGHTLPALPLAERVAVHRVDTLDLRDEAARIAATLEGDHGQWAFVNHYSNYNRRRSWSALSLRGYSADPSFIEKPTEMPAKWQRENACRTFVLQDTALMDRVPAVREVVAKLGGVVERVRLMRLKPGDGELARHTDQVDAAVGVTDGKILRVHVPVVTNPDVVFRVWGEEPRRVHMAAGECWYLDIRKPHAAVNAGDTWRVHLVVDVVASDTTRRLLQLS